MKNKNPRKDAKERGKGRQNSPQRHRGHEDGHIFTEDNEGNEG
jgi:hypothetical protein